MITNTNSNIESFLNVEPYVSGFLKNAFLFPVRYLSNIATIFFRSYTLYNPKIWIDARNFTQENKVHEITHKSASDTLFEEGSQKAPSKERLIEVLEKVQTIAKNLGITNSVKLYSSIDHEGDIGEAFGTSLFSRNDAHLILSVDLINGSDKVLDFVIAHELSHVANSDPIKELIANVSEFAIETFTLIIFPLALPLVCGAHYLFEAGFSQHREKQADLSAVKTLNSSEGGVELFTSQISYKKHEYDEKEAAFKSSEDKTAYYNEGSFKERMLKKIVSYISSAFHFPALSEEGNERGSIFHPSNTERLRYFEEFKPETKTEAEKVEKSENLQRKDIPKDLSSSSSLVDKTFLQALDNQQLSNAMGAKVKATPKASSKAKKPTEAKSKTEPKVTTTAKKKKSGETHPLDTFQKDLKEVILTTNGAFKDHDIVKVINLMTPARDLIQAYKYDKKTHEFSFTLKECCTGTVGAFANKEEAISGLLGVSLSYQKTLKGKMIPGSRDKKPEIQLEDLHVSLPNPLSSWLIPLPNIGFTPTSVSFSPKQAHSDRYEKEVDMVDIHVEGVPLFGTISRERETARLVHSFSNVEWS